MTLLPEIPPQLEQHYRKGTAGSVTARETGVKVSTVYWYFRKFHRAGIPRGPVKRRFNRGRYERRPVYNGPHWIGQPISPPPAELGPGWIGKRIPYRDGKSSKQ